MNEDQLARLIEQPEVQRRILGDYSRGFSLGVTRNPANPQELAIRVRVEGNVASQIPSEITLEGQIIPTLITGQFKPPVPY